MIYSPNFTDQNSPRCYRCASFQPNSSTNSYSRHLKSPIEFKLHLIQVNIYWLILSARNNRLANGITLKSV